MQNPTGSLKHIPYCSIRFKGFCLLVPAVNKDTSTSRSPPRIDVALTVPNHV